MWSQEDEKSFMKKSIVIRNINKLDNEDIKYWSRKTPEERLEALQYLREQYIVLFNKQNLYNESRKRLRRFYKITKLSQS